LGMKDINIVKTNKTVYSGCLINTHGEVLNRYEFYYDESVQKNT